MNSSVHVQELLVYIINFSMKLLCIVDMFQDILWVLEDFWVQDLAIFMWQDLREMLSLEERFVFPN